MQKKSIFSKGSIPLPLYKKILGLMPICCVDMILKVGSKVILFKRAYEPAKNEWWLIGGRVNKWEKLRDAAIRKAKEEVGIDVKIIKTVGTYEIFFPVNRFDAKNIKKEEKGTHTIAICFIVKPKKKDFKLKLNNEYTRYKAITKIENNFHPYIKTALKDSGINLK